MKLQAYQLCQLCDEALRGRRRWFWLGGNLLILLLGWLLGLLSSALAAVGLANATLALYLLHRHHAFGAAYLRTPRPEDARCETVLIDASLIGQGTRLRAASQPIDVADGLSLRLGSGTLLMGAAMVLTADELPTAERAAILSAVQQLNIKPDRMRSHSPVLRRESLGAVTVVSVREGIGERRYYLGAPEEVARHCAAIWEGHSRPLTEQDPLRIADTARYIAQGNCRVYGYATAIAEEAPIFLGMAGLGEEVHLTAMKDIAALRSLGLTVMLTPGAQADTDLDALRALLDLPDHHARADLHLTPDEPLHGSGLSILCSPGESLLSPVTTLRQHFRTMEDTLRHFSQLLLFALGAAVLCGCPALGMVGITAALLAVAIFLGVDLTTARLRLPTLILGALLALGARLFLGTQLPALAAMAAGIIAWMGMGAAVLRLSGRGFRLTGEGCLPARILLGCAGLCLLALILFGVTQGLACLLPMGFALLIGGALGLLVRFEQKILR